MLTFCYHIRFNNQWKQIFEQVFDILFTNGNIGPWSWYLVKYGSNKLATKEKNFNFAKVRGSLMWAFSETFPEIKHFLDIIPQFNQSVWYTLVFNPPGCHKWQRRFATPIEVEIVLPSSWSITKDSVWTFQKFLEIPITFCGSCLKCTMDCVEVACSYVNKLW